ncbi:MAG TPA: type II toxin-antitoxin system HicB family antitoxin [Candidatus Paceibacterota bacterium]
MKNKLHYSVIFQAESEGGYTAITPALPGCVSYGKTIEKAKINIKGAMELYLESLAAHGEKPGIENNTFVSSVEISPVRAYA